ncbi:MAG: DsrE family protein [Candidatus Freyarchaeota archaeon]|nr:DsrE family protein [Candidatus Jordarchaeia archaeon]
MKVVIVVLDPPSSDRARKIMGLLEELAGLGTEVSVYFLGDGVYWGIKGCLDRFANSRAEFFVEEGDLEARGIQREILSERVNIVSEIVERLVYEIMERAERVISV